MMLYQIYSTLTIRATSWFHAAVWSHPQCIPWNPYPSQLEGIQWPSHKDSELLAFLWDCSNCRGFSKIVRYCQASLLILQLCFIHCVLTKRAWGSKTCNLPCHSVPIYLQVGKPGHPKYLSPNDVCYSDWANSLPHLLDGFSLRELDLLLHNFF